MRFLRVVDSNFGPDSLAVLIVEILAGKDLFKAIADFRALDDLLDAAGNNVVLDVDANGFAIQIDALKPIEYALVEANILAGGSQIFFCYVNALLLAKLYRGIEIPENALHIILFAVSFYSAPKFGRGHIKVGNKRIVLHILIAQSLIKIVHQGNGWFLFHNLPLLYPLFCFGIVDFGRCGNCRSVFRFLACLEVG